MKSFNIFRVTSLAHSIVSEYLTKGDIAIDATIGNGNDTVFLAQSVGNEGHVFGFDIQERAYNSTKEVLYPHGLQNTVTLFLANHIAMKKYIPEQYHGTIKAIMFNLGYLPGYDKNLTTETHSTISALHDSCGLLKSSGIITISVYNEQNNGTEEQQAVMEFVKTVPSKYFETAHIHYPGRLKTPPELFVIRKR